MDWLDNIYDDIVVPYAENKIIDNSEPKKQDDNIKAYQDIQQNKASSSSVKNTESFIEKNKTILMIGGAVLIGGLIVFRGK